MSVSSFQRHQDRPELRPVRFPAAALPRSREPRRPGGGAGGRAQLADSGQPRAGDPRHACPVRPDGKQACEEAETEESPLESRGPVISCDSTSFVSRTELVLSNLNKSRFIAANIGVNV